MTSRRYSRYSWTRDLDRCRRRDREDRAEDAEQGAAEEHRDQDDERLDLRRPLLDLRLDQVVLDLLVDDREDHPDDQRDREVDEGGDDPDEHRADRRADHGDQVDDEDHHRQRAGERHPEDGQHDERGEAGDRRLQQRAPDVVADGVRDSAQGSLDPLRVLRSLHPDEALDPSAARGRP